MEGRAEQAAKRVLDAGCETRAQREKRWDECGIEEKVERLRVVLRAVGERSLQAQRVAVEAVDVARRHEHGAQMQVVMPCDDRNHALATIAKVGVEGDFFTRLLS
ncbi:MAG: hypothetical protein EPO20_14620 [Betaproteobacteria bacterium]|nr:MAG: hypothetical protein EPO20_14620 [Betaproteobacteria bacterium]